MTQAMPNLSPIDAVTNDAIAGKALGKDVDHRSRQTIEDEIERLIAMLDEADPDPDLEEGGDDEFTIGGGMLDQNTDRELDSSDDEPSLGWTHLFDQSSRKWIGWCGDSVLDGEDEHDGREPDADLEVDQDAETGSDDDASDAERNPAYAERLRHRRRSSGGGDRPMTVKEFLDVMERLSPADKAAVAGRLKREVRS